MECAGGGGTGDGSKAKVDGGKQIRRRLPRSKVNKAPAPPPTHPQLTGAVQSGDLPRAGPTQLGAGS